ncbi:MAG: trigger factor [Candidatus Aminicenantes bacterium]|nr:trigger factor [Candidatus Aminicenantes bacterium]
MNHDTGTSDTESDRPAGSEGNPAPASPQREENPLLARFQITMTKEDIAREIDALAVRYGRKVKIPGFRQGKVPVEVVKKVHKQALHDEVIQQAVNRLALEHIRNDKLAVAGEPYVEKIESREGEDLLANIAVETLPEIDLPDLESLHVELQATALKNEEYDEAREIERVLEAHKRSQPVSERAIAENDLVVLLLQSTDTSRKRKWPRREYPFLMKREGESEIPGLYDGLLGKKAGERILLAISYPAESAKRAWAGKTIKHEGEIKAVYEWKKPDLDQEFIGSLGLRSVEEFKEKLREEHRRHQEQHREELVLEAVFEKLLATSRFPVPRSLQEQEVARRITSIRRPLNFENDEEKDRFKEQILAQAEKSIRLSLLLERVREKYQIAVGDEDLEREYARLARDNQLPEKEIRRYYGDKQKAVELKDHLLQNKINGFLKEKIKVKEV